jgi:hypothetical protein
MTNPDDATTLTGLAAGLVDPLGMSSNTIYGSSTHGGATDTGRGDLDNGGGGGATGELNGKLTAGPETNPDEATVNDGTLVDQYHKGDGIGTVDGVRPDLAGDGLGPIGPPVDDGVTPYAAGIGDASGGTSGTATGGALGGHHDVAGSLSSEVHVDGISAEHADLNPGVGMALSPNADDHGDMGFGGPGDDGLG